MTTDEADEEGSRTERTREELRRTRERIGEGADRAVRGFDDNVVDLLSWLLDTETRARIYVFLREHPDSTSGEVADGTGLYPSTVREALAELHDEGKVTRRKRESSGAGNNPYEYEAIAPSELVQGVVGDVQRELNAVFNLDRRLGGESRDGDRDPVRISVDGAGDDGEHEDGVEGNDEPAGGVEDGEDREGGVDADGDGGDRPA
ncbi:winged helix-turn-helix domain-containing protein [Halorubrum vacuolatum]|uniref:Predicted transcriptional regulator n=1 Tax=Halorubrum vacuolatum TaxID=63740 RepID=A0A238WJ50_HALVU|nr:winged helix-turn-helix domain-containing protein [Halorubrum vacuolatum]SNR46517.1 Predicted transcriptional regulator [Halorubrum vacuolatum]